MKLLATLLTTIALTGCAGTIANTKLGDVIHTDLVAAQANYTLAASRQPVDSVLAKQFAADAHCMELAAARLNPAPEIAYTNDGVISLGSIIHIQASEGESASFQMPPECNQLVGEVLTNFNKQLIKAGPSLLIK